MYNCTEANVGGACLVGTVVRRWTTVLEVVGSNPALAKQRIKFIGLLRLPAGVGL